MATRSVCNVMDADSGGLSVEAAAALRLELYTVKARKNDIYSLEVEGVGFRV